MLAFKSKTYRAGECLCLATFVRTSRSFTPVTLTFTRWPWYFKVTYRHSHDVPACQKSFWVNVLRVRAQRQTDVSERITNRIRGWEIKSYVCLQRHKARAALVRFLVHLLHSESSTNRTKCSSSLSQQKVVWTLLKPSLKASLETAPSSIAADL